MESRTTRRNRQKQRKRLGKTSYFLLFGLAVLSGLLITTIVKFKLEENHINMAMNQLVQSETTRQQVSGQMLETYQDNKNIASLLFLPTGGEKTLPESLKSGLIEHMQTAIKKVKGKGNRKALIIASLKKQQVAAKVEGFVSAINSYHWEARQNKFVAQAAEEQSMIYLNPATYQKISMKDLVATEEDLLGLQRVVTEKLLSETPAGQEKTVFDLPGLTFETTIDYTPEKITIALPQTVNGQNAVAITYQEMAAYVRQDFFAEPKETTPTEALPSKAIALTFDDGPLPATTMELLPILAQYNVPASFFMLGSNVEKYPEVVKAVHQGGHVIGSHSYSHPQLPSLAPEVLRQEVQRTDQAIYQLTGEVPKNFRPPYGAVDGPTAKIIGKAIIQWDVDSEDWRSLNTTKIVERVKGSVDDGSIILMHDIYPETIQAVPQIIEALKTQGYQFVTVNQLLANQQKPLHQYFGQQDERKIQ